MADCLPIWFSRPVWIRVVLSAWIHERGPARYEPWASAEASTARIAGTTERAERHYDTCKPEPAIDETHDAQSVTTDMNQISPYG